MSTDQGKLFSNVPQDLRDEKRWVCWTVEKRDGKETKVPINAIVGGYAKSNDPDTWTDFKVAVTYLHQHKGLAGIGFMFGGGFIGVDLDHVVDDGEIDADAEKIISRVNSYSEFSPSGTGVHILCRGRLPLGGRKRGHVEMYDAGRFFTITGNQIPGTPGRIEQRTAELQILHDEVFKKPQENPQRELGAVHIDDTMLLQKARSAANGAEFSNLFDGDFSSYLSQSEADLALCSMLAFWTGKDPAAIDRLFRQSKLMRPKWDERHYGDGRTYGQENINKAVSGTRDAYKSRTHGDPQPVYGECSTSVPFPLPLTDAGNAQRLAVYASENFRFVPQWGKWIRWTGQKWEMDDGKSIVQAAILTARKMIDKAQGMADNERQEFIKHSLRSESGHRLNQMISLAASFPFVQIDLEKLDSHPLLFNCQNGTLDLATGDFRGHSKDDFLTQISPVSYDPGKGCPKWNEHLETILMGNANLISFIQLASGYSLGGLMDERCFFLLYGSGRNGKSTTIKTIAQILGDYAVRTSVETILTKPGNQIPSDLAALRGKRFAYTGESEEGRRLAESLIKDVTGQEAIAARFLYGEWFNFIPRFKLWVSSNHLPQIKGTDHAIWDRVRRIDFTYRIPEENQRPMEMFIQETFGPEFSGILNWMVQGFRDWKQFGLFTPEEVKTATESYKTEMDILAQFLAECCIREKIGEILSKELYGIYVKWCEDNGERAISQNKFSLRLTEKGFQKRHDRAGSVWLGLNKVVL